MKALTILFVLCAMSSVVQAQTTAPTATQSNAQTEKEKAMCALAAGTMGSPALVAGVSLPNQTKLGDAKGLSLQDGNVVDFTNGDFYVYGGPNKGTPHFYARYKEETLDNEANAPHVGMLRMDPTKLQNGIECPVGGAYQPHWFGEVQTNDIICVRREKENKVTYGVLQVDAVCNDNVRGIAFNWIYSPTGTNIFAPPQSDISITKP